MLEAENRLRAHQAVEPAQEVVFQGQLLRGRLEHVVAVGDREGKIGGGVDSRQGRLDPLGGDVVLLDHRLQRLADVGERALQRFLGDVVEAHIDAVQREGEGDAVAHRPGADDADSLDH